MPYLVDRMPRNNTKNKLEKAVQEYFDTISRTVVPDLKLWDFLNGVSDHISKLNADFPRCTASILSSWNTDQSTFSYDLKTKVDIMVSVGFDRMKLLYFNQPS